MRISYNWLQTFFIDKLPEVNTVAEAISSHIFEVEEIVSTTSGDKVLEIDVLPNRAGDCLSHRGIALELSASLNLPIKDIRARVLVTDTTLPSVAVEVLAGQCQRYLGRLVRNITITKSPEWLAEKVEVMGGRSINNIVDLTNFVLFELGQPLHAFDADKVAGGITVRLAQAGEKMETLDGKKLELTGEDLVIADDEGVLALAGVKGGTKAVIDNNTKNIILESASFQPTTVRRSAGRHGIRTDASKRYENNLAPETAEVALELLSQYILDLLPEASLSDWTDVFPKLRSPKNIEVSLRDINLRLGIEIALEEVVEILTRLRFQPVSTGEKITMTIPFDRQDILGRDDIVEEVGRMFGYDKIKSKELTPSPASADDRYFVATQKLREVLLQSGFSEIYGYTFAERGEIEVANPLAKDKPFLRTNLTDNLEEKIVLNLRHVLFETDPVKIFDIGTVFQTDKEQINICFGVGFTKAKYLSKDDSLKKLQEKLAEVFKVNLSPKVTKKDNLEIWEIGVDTLVDSQVEPVNLKAFMTGSDTVYKPISIYPRIIRDIALFVPQGTEATKVAKIITDTAGELLLGEPILFDEFTKEGETKTSLAFRLVFQSFERTLEDLEVNNILEKITIELEKNQGLEVRK